MSRSLLNPDQQSLSLLDEVPEQAVAVQHEVGTYSAELFFDREPTKYKAVVWLLSQNVGKLKIADKLGVSVHTVIAIAEREGETIAIEKKKIAASARRGCGLMVESIIQDLEEGRSIQPRDKAVIAGILKDVAAHMDGEAQIRIEAVISTPAHDQFNRELAQATGIEVLDTGFESGAPEQKGAAGGELAAPGEADDPGGSEQQEGAESDG